jgi:hypothetical protein
LNSLFNTGFNQAERPMVVAGQSCSLNQGNQIFNPAAFTLVGYQIGTISPNMEPRGYCHGPSLMDTDLSIDKNFKLTERVRMQFRIDLFDAFNHANFRADGIGSVNGGTVFSGVNCGAAACSPTNSVIQGQTITNNFGQATTVVGNAGREIQYGLHITF